MPTRSFLGWESKIAERPHLVLDLRLGRRQHNARDFFPLFFCERNREYSYAMQGQIPVAVCGRARSLPVSPLVLCVEEAVRGPAGAGAGTGSRLTGWEQAPEDTTSSRGGNGRSSRAVARASGRRQARRAHPRTGTGTRRRSSSRRAGGRPSHCAKAEPPYGSNPTLPHARRTVLPHRQ